MRLNNNDRIITDDDIIMSDGSKSLSDVLSSQQKQISQLASNVKWIYKYGGVGGSGGGGGSSSTYSIFATLNQIQLKGQSIVLNGPGFYKLNITINNPNNGSFNVKYGYTIKSNSGNLIKQEQTVILSIENNYSVEVLLNLNVNSDLQITVSDGNETKQAKCTYIVYPYEFSLDLIDNEGESVPIEHFIEVAAAKGVNVRLKYVVSINANIKYKYSFLKESIEGEITDKANEILFPIKKDLFKPENAGFYTANVDLSIIPEGQSLTTVNKNISFSLIPNNLYLLIQPQVGIIYDKETVDHYEYVPGYITFDYRIYEGISQNRTYNVSINLNGSNVIKESVTERQQNTFKLFTITPGLNRLEVNVSRTSTYTKVYYLYVQESTLNFDWFDNPEDWISYYYRINETTSNFEQYKNKLYIEQTVTSPTIKISGITPPNVSANALVNTHIAIGLQYSSINSENPIIFNFYNSSAGNSPVFSISQQSLDRLGQTSKIYIARQDNYDKEDTSKYHLIQAYSQFVKRIGNDYYYQISVYIDGILESVFGQITSVPLLLDSLQILPTNCFINLLEVDYNEVLEDTRTICDYDVYKFYLKYQHAILRKDVTQEVLLLDYIKNFNVGLNGRISINQADINNIAKNIDTPVLIMTYQDDGQFDSLGGFMNALEAGYGEDGTAAGADMNFRVSVAWSPGRNGVEDIQLPQGFENARFRASLQGSSTKMYRVKNFDLAIENITGTEEDDVFLYSPNFKNSDSSTFLPETKFTLKADIVDSSHSNNTSCGRFINTVCRKFSEDIQEDGYYRNYIKNCLDGFPTIVFICHVLEDTLTGQVTYNYYYLGIYNFNLGRSSYFNLGYKDLSIFGNATDKLLSDAGNQFTFFKIPASQNTLKQGLGVAEIQGGDPHFDFSQWDPTILFQQIETDPRYMFGDLVYGSNGTEQQLKSAISKFVEKVAKSGGYLFDFLKKKKGKYETDDVTEGSGYNAEVYLNGQPTGESKNQVPDYSVQYTKQLDPSGQWVFKAKEQEPIVGQKLDLQNLIIPDVDSGKQASLNFQAVSEYYTICMVLGLVDSVMKNLNIKSWNVKSDGTGTWYPAFYDMDTCLGINNQGNPITYFAFSDYWNSQIKKTLNDVEYPSAVQIYRDFSPHSLGENGYDVPTNYLFTVAKYAKLIFTDNTSEQAIYLSQYPQELYAKWRSNVINKNTHEGVLKNADEFMKNFFANNLAAICPALVSLNYRSKYLKLATEQDTVWVATDFNKFNGTRVNQVHDWLAGRLHILDVYFNLNRSMPQTITFRNESGKWETLMNGTAPVVDTMYTTNYDLENNEDVIILKDIFSANGGQGVQLSGFTSFQIRCPEFSPLQIYNQIGSVHQNFILGGDKNQQIEFTPTGVQAIKLGGSQAWTYLQNINWITTSGLYISSNKLENITGSVGKFTSLQLHTPNVRTISLTSPNYSGILNLNGFQNYPNLTEIDISNSNISLTANNLRVKRIYLNNIKAPNAEVSITNCSELVTLQIGRITLRSLNLEGLKGNLINLNLTGTSINNLTVRCAEPGGSFTLNGDRSITSLTIGDFKTVKVYNCPNLKKIIINKKIVQDVEVLDIINCDAIGLSVTSSVSETNKVTLATSKIKQFRLQNNSYVTDVELPDNTVLLSDGFAGCAKLKSLTGNNIQFGYNTFNGCKAFNIRDKNGRYASLKVASTTTNLSNAFNFTGISWADVKQIIDVYIPDDNSITNVTRMFQNCDLTFDENDLKVSIAQNNYPKFEKLNKVTNATNMFATQWNQQGISALNKRIMQMGSPNGCNYANLVFASNKQKFFMPKDIFEGTIQKIITFPFGGDLNTTKRIVFTDIQGNPLPEDTPIKLSEIFNPGGVSPSKAITLDYFNPYNTYTWDWTGVFNAQWKALNKMTMVCAYPCKYKGLDGLFTTLPKPIQFQDCWNTSEVEDYSVDYYTMFNWDQQVKLSVIFDSRNRNLDDRRCNRIQKHISADNYVLLCDKLLKSKTLTSLQNVFKFTTVIGSLGEWKLSDTVINTNITSVTQAFYNFKNITQQDSTTINFLQLSKNFFKCLPNISYAIETFVNCKIGNPIPFDFFSKRYKETENVWVKKQEEYVEGVLTIYKYNQQLSDTTRLFYNCEWDSTALQYTPELYNIPANQIVDQEGNTYQQYYRRTMNPDGSYIYHEYQLPENTEITDAQNLQGKHVASITNGNSSISNPQIVGDVNKLIVPPDLFYGLKFNLQNVGSINQALYCKTPLNGIVPKHLLKNSPQVEFTELFKNQVIIPQLVKSWDKDGKKHNLYVHFPSQFTTRTNLSNCFTAKYIVLGNTNLEVNYSLVLLQDSIPKSVNYLNSTFDSKFVAHYQGAEISTKNYEFNFIGKLNGDEVVFGFDTRYFDNLYLDSMYYSPYMTVVKGNLFHTDFDAGYLNVSELNYVINLTQAQHSGISRNAIMPKATRIVTGLAPIGSFYRELKSSQILESTTSKPFYTQAGWIVVD